MPGPGRYVRVMFALARYSLAREMAFRGNFIAKVTVEVLWLGLLVIFYRTVFAQTEMVADWSEPQWLFFVGCYYALGSVIETLFLDNFNEFSGLVRSGDLDFYLLRPIDEQFLVSCHGVEWSTVPSAVLGGFLMVVALVQLGWEFDLAQLAMFAVLFVCGVALAYGFLLTLASTSIWFVRNQSLYELWWLFSSLMRYPREIFARVGWAMPVGWFFTFVIPVMVVVTVPAGVMVRGLFDPFLIGYTVVATVALLAVSRWFFRFSLRRYRSASS
jgi:ABC-2 type transport system permease protein